MRLATFNGDHVGVILGDGIVDVTDLSGLDPGFWPPVHMVRIIATCSPAELERAARGRALVPLADVRLEPPIRWPNKVIAFPANYHAHIDEMRAVGRLVSKAPASGQGFFLKANSSLSGPADPVGLPPIAAREVHHEGELGIIIGKGGRGIAPAAAAAHIFGFTCLLDMVVRGKEERVMRKSFDRFCPTGPWIVTADSVRDWDRLQLSLRVNGEERQLANTRDLIVGIGEMVAMASSVMTLEPGDIIASGTPAGVGPVDPGDVIELTIDQVGTLRVGVEAVAAGDHPVWHVERMKEIA